jgi:hypothetical protein
MWSESVWGAVQSPPQTMGIEGLGDAGIELRGPGAHAVHIAEEVYGVPGEMARLHGPGDGRHLIEQLLLARERPKSFYHAKVHLGAFERGVAEAHEVRVDAPEIQQRTLAELERH